MFIHGNIPSLKNSKVKTARGIFSSPTVTKFLRSVGIQGFNSRKKTVKGYVDPSRPNIIEALRTEFEQMLVGKGKPIFIGYHQIRSSKRLFDFSNSVEIIQDLFTAHDFIPDDDVSNVFPIPMTINGELPTKDNVRTEKFYSVDKENPGVWIRVF
jgi:hypothetical protein